MAVRDRFDVDYIPIADGPPEKNGGLGLLVFACKQPHAVVGDAYRRQHTFVEFHDFSAGRTLVAVAGEVEWPRDPAKR